jgi:hypothetical protein
LQGRFFGENGDLDGLKAAELAMPRGEQIPAGKGRGTALDSDRPEEESRIVKIVENNKGSGTPVEFIKSRAELEIGRLVECLRQQPGTDSSKSFSERLGGVDPEKTTRVVSFVSIDILDGELGLPDSSHAGEPGGSNADWLALLKGLMQPVQVLAASDEVGVSRKRHEERSWARRVLLHYQRRAYRKFARAS